MKKKTLLSWSSGKDCTYALMKLQQDPEIDLAGLFCTVNSEAERVAMHGVRRELLVEQSKKIGLPIKIIDLPSPCSHEIYCEIMKNFIKEAKEEGVDCFAFGDLFLEDVRNYRIDNMAGSGIEPIFPIWGTETGKLSRKLIDLGIKTKISCIDTRKVEKSFAGKDYDREFLNSLPRNVDPCGENGEFHTFVYDAPIFSSQIEIEVGQKHESGDFLFMDLKLL